MKDFKPKGLENEFKMLKKQKKVLKSSRNHVNILGVRLDSTSQARVLALLEDFIVRGQKFSVFTANPELLVMAAKNQSLKEIVNTDDLVIPDGIGLKYAAKL